MQAEEIFAIMALQAVGTRALPELDAGALELGQNRLASDLGGALEPDLARGDGVRGLGSGLVGKMGDALGGLCPLRRIRRIRRGLRCASLRPRCGLRCASLRLRCGLRRVTADNRVPPRANATRALRRVLCPGFRSRYALLRLARFGSTDSNSI